MSATTPAANGEHALGRMRRYTTISLVVVVAFYAGATSLSAQSLPYGIAVALVGALTALYTGFWERTPPIALTAVVLTASTALWIACLILREAPIAVLLLMTAVMVPISQQPRHRARLIAGAVLFALVPVAIGWIVDPSVQWWIPALLVIVCAICAAVLLLLNRYAWGLYLEIDSARRLGADLAVAEERYRFAADLHDIQGHTLHVLRLKTRLAARLLETDPKTAAEHLREADALIAETLANTRTLAFGERRVALASELSNAQALFEAAGIECRVTGSSAGAHDELFGLVVRESTTNILRHAQPSLVTIDIAPGRLMVANDGSPAASRPPSGLARLGERFEAIGGSLRTSTGEGRFTTEAVTP